MPVPPVLPPDFKAVIPNPSDSVCTQFVKALLQFPYRLWLLVSWMFTDSGAISDNFGNAICAKLTELGCTSGGGTTTTTTGTGTTTTTTTTSGTPPAAPNDLEMSQGLGYGIGTGGGDRRLFGRFTKTANSVSYKIYRNTVDNFNTSTLISTGNVPVRNDILGPLPDLNVPMYDGEDFITFYDTTITNLSTVYYYWIKAVGVGGATSAASNAGVGASGWAGQKSPFNAGNYIGLTEGFDYTIPAGRSKVRIVAYGVGGDGAGGGELYGGGGGGGCALGIAEYDVVPGDVLSVVNDIANTGSDTPAETSGSSHPDMVISLNAVEIMRFVSGAGGVYNPAGGGSGGAAGTVLFTSGDNQVTKAGRPGYAASGVNGGNGGASYFGWRYSMFNRDIGSGEFQVGGGSPACSSGSRATEDASITHLATGKRVCNNGSIVIQEKS